MSFGMKMKCIYLLKAMITCTIAKQNGKLLILMGMAYMI